MKTYKVSYIENGIERNSQVVAESRRDAEEAVLRMLDETSISKIHAQEVKEETTSFKNDRADNKLRWELLPLGLIEEVVKVYTFGASKYAPNTWQNLTDGYERYKAALLRHIVSYEKGETEDPESGIHPLAHAAWNAIAMLHFATKDNT